MLPHLFDASSCASQCGCHSSLLWVFSPNVPKDSCVSRQGSLTCHTVAAFQVWSELAACDVCALLDSALFPNCFPPTHLASPSIWLRGWNVSGPSGSTLGLLFSAHPGQSLLVSLRILLWPLYTDEPPQFIFPLLIFVSLSLSVSRWKLSISTWMGLGHLRIGILSFLPIFLFPVPRALLGWTALPSPYSSKTKNLRHR